jgi:hypothetical protein
MKWIVSSFVFVIIIISSVSSFSSEESSLYELENGYIVTDVSFDSNTDSFYLTGNLEGSNSSFIIKSKDGQFLREQMIENFKISKILNDDFSNTYLIGTSREGTNSLIKLTSSLTKRWETSIKFSEMDTLSSFTVNDKQEVTVIGYSTFKRESDSFIVKIDRNGNIISKKVLDVGPYERPYAILEDFEGNFYITGESKNKNYDMFVCKLTNDFDILWVDFYDNDNWEDGGLDLELIGGDVVAAGYSGKEGWYVFDTVFLRYSPDGNASKFTRKSFSGGSDWIKQLNGNGDYYYAFLWDILTGKEYYLKLDYYFDILKKEEIGKEETPIKIINIKDKTYFVFSKENTIYTKDLE